MKKVIIVLLALICLTGCGSKDAKTFKEEYESLNGTYTSSNNEYRSVSIAKNNPFVYITAEELIEKIESEETFYVYFGSKYCPWCRSVIEKFIEVANKYDIDVVYYIDIWDDDINEILRDVYFINEDNDVELSISGTEEYFKLLNYFDSVLTDYTLTDNYGNTITAGEKRIYAPNFIYVESGVAKKLVSGISSYQSGAYDELTDEILEDEERIFTGFFEN